MTGGPTSVDALVAEWPGDRHGLMVVDREGTRRWWGDPDAVFDLASVTKLLTAMAVWVAVEERTLTLDDPLEVDGGPPMATLRHLLAHASGLGPESADRATAPGTRRIYSNAGFELVDRVLSAAAGLSTADYLRLGVLEPLSMSHTIMTAGAAHGAVGSARDLGAWAVEVLRPTLVDPATIAEATTVQFPGLDGVLPGYGVQRPNPWGLGIEIRGHKTPHWTAPDNDPSTFGHFGRSGTFVWVDPVIGLGLVGLGDVDFGPWAVDLWPRLSAAVLEESRLGRL